MDGHKSRLSSKGQVTIPAELREAVGLHAGDVVAYELRDEGIYLARVEPFDAAFHAALSATLDEWTSAEDDEAFREL
jgi:AbrB family looped-hinge helix DNA binding protein